MLWRSVPYNLLLKPRLQRHMDLAHCTFLVEYSHRQFRLYAIAGNALATAIGKVQLNRGLLCQTVNHRYLTIGKA